MTLVGHRDVHVARDVASVACHQRETTTRNLVNFSGIGRGEVRDVRDGELTWNAFIDAIAEKALISGGGHHGYRRGFAVGCTACGCALLLSGIAKTSPSFRQLPFGPQRNAPSAMPGNCQTAGTELRCQIPVWPIRDEKKKAGHHQHTSLAVQQFQARRRCLPSPWVSATSMPERECPAYRRFTLRRSHRHPGVACNPSSLFSARSENSRTIAPRLTFPHPLSDLPTHSRGQ